MKSATPWKQHFEKTKAEFRNPSDDLVNQITAYFEPPVFNNVRTHAYEEALENDPVLRSFVETNVAEHKNPAYGIVTISTKPIGGTPGDVTSDQMRVIADLAEQYGHNEIRISHEQNAVLPHVRKADIPLVHAALKAAGLATANIGLISDIIACPGMDYCALATARSIPIAQEISTRFDELKLEKEIGELKIKISGCINACGHHHVGHIGILGLDKAGIENYQITLGGDATHTMALGERAGPGFSAEELLPALERLLNRYLEIRDGSEEIFLETYRRVGALPFQQALYPEEEKYAA